MRFSRNISWKSSKSVPGALSHSTSQLPSILLSGCVSSFNHSLVNEHLGCFWYYSNRNKDGIKNCIPTFILLEGHFLDKFLEVWLLGQKSKCVCSFARLGFAIFASKMVIPIPLDLTFFNLSEFRKYVFCSTKTSFIKGYPDISGK